jgi:hypothetical protein
MPDKNLISMGSKSFEDLKKINEYGADLKTPLTWR